MRLLLYLVAIAICEGARLPRGVNHHFPHFKAIYHGHGATSYQNVQIQSHGSVPIPNNYVEHIDDHHSSNHLSHGSVSNANNYAEHIHEYHPSEHLTHVSIPLANNDVEHVHDHYSLDNLHNSGLHEVQAIVEVPVEHETVEHYVVSTLAPYIENEHQHFQLKLPEATQYYLYNHQHDYEYH